MTIAIVGTLDTKGQELGFVRDRIEAAGETGHLIDTGVLDEPAISPDTDRVAVAAAADATVDELAAAGDRGDAMEAMATGAATVVRDLYDAGDLEGIIAAGGSGNTTIGTTAMRALPFGVPKVMVSTMASGDVRPYVEHSDITMVHAVADVEGLNRLTRTVLANAAHAIVGMVEHTVPEPRVDRPTIGVTMFGVTTPCVQHARTVLEERGYEVVVFHATGTGGKALESLIRQGSIDGVLDVTTTELADELVGGVLSAGPDRLTAAAETGTPQVISTGALDMVNFGPRESVPERFADRLFHEHNPTVTLMRTTVAENRELGRELAEKANEANGPTTVALPRGGVSALDVPGEPFYNEAADGALFDAITDHLVDDIGLLELDRPINDPAFAETVADELDALVGERGED